MQYISTRNIKKTFTFKDVFLNALAFDGGLYVPKDIPFYSTEELNNLKELSYEQISKIISLPLGTVKSRINRARIKLKELLNY